MIEIKKFKKIIPPWRQLSFDGRSPLFKVSLIVMFIIPIWARLTNIDLQYNNHISNYLIGFLDNKIPPIPNNLLRIFWASFSINIANIAYFIFCPKITRFKNFQHWFDADEDVNDAYSLRIKQEGASNKNAITNDMKNEYNKKISDSNYCRISARIFISILYLFSIILIIRTMIYQIIPVFSITNFFYMILN